MPSFKVLDMLTLKVGIIVDPICITDRSAFTIGGLALRSSFFFSCSFFLLSDFFSDLDSDLLSDLDSLLELSVFVSPPELSDDELDDDDSPEEDADWEEEEDEDEVEGEDEEGGEDVEVPDVDAAAVEAALELAADAAEEAA